MDKLKEESLKSLLLSQSHIRYGKSYEEIYESSMSFLRAINPSWNNLTETDIAAMIIHVMSYIGSMNNYYLDRAVQELHPNYATEDSSKLAIASFLGHRRNSIKASRGVARLYLRGNYPQGLIDIPKYYPIALNTANGRDMIVAASEDNHFQLDKFDCLKVKIPNYQESSNSRHPVIYLKVNQGSIVEFEIEDAGIGLESYANHDHNIISYCDANPNLQIVLVERSGAIESVVLNSNILNITEVGDFSSNNKKLIFPYIDIAVTEGVPQTLRLAKEQVLSDEIYTHLQNIDWSTLEVTGPSGRVWERVENILYDYDPYGLNSEKYSLRLDNAESAMVVELNKSWESYVDNSVPYLFNLRYLVSSAQGSDVVENTPVKLIRDLGVHEARGDEITTLSALFLDGKVVSRIKGGQGLKSASEELLLARIGARSQKTIITVPDLAGAVRRYKDRSLAIAADINEDEESKKYIASKLGRKLDTYEMYYSILSESLEELTPGELGRLKKEIVAYKHIFIKDFYYIPPEINEISLKLKINLLRSYLPGDLRSNIIDAIILLYSSQSPLVGFNATPSIADIIKSIKLLEEDIGEVKVEKTESLSTPTHLFRVHKLKEVKMEFIGGEGEFIGGYKYDTSKK